MHRISIPSSVAAMLAQHAEDHTPNEACGILLGSMDGPACMIQKAILTSNADNSPVRFSISDMDVIHAYRAAEIHGVEVVGIYHSHPISSAVPSGRDITYMELNPGVWIIRSGLDGRMRAWVRSDTVREVTLHIEQNASTH